MQSVVVTRCIAAPVDFRMSPRAGLRTRFHRFCSRDLRSAIYRAVSRRWPGPQTMWAGGGRRCPVDPLWKRAVIDWSAGSQGSPDW